VGVGSLKQTQPFFIRILVPQVYLLVAFPSSHPSHYHFVILWESKQPNRRQRALALQSYLSRRLNFILSALRLSTMVWNPEPQYHSPGHSSTQLRTSGISKEQLGKIALIPVAHLICCFALAFCMIYLLDGYNALPSESLSQIWTTQFKLSVGDVTTLISSALIIIKLLVSAWTGTVIWNCVFMLLEGTEGTGATLSQIKRITTFYIPPVTTRYIGLLVVFILLLVIPQQLISPILTGAVNWSPGSEYNPSLVNVQAGNPDSVPSDWQWWYHATRWRRSFVRRASSFASITWENTLSPDRGHCRHIMNQGDVISINSTLLGAIVPCIQIHSITFPQSFPSNQLFDLVQNDALSQNDSISRVEDPPFEYLRDGNAVLFDPNDLPGLFGNLPWNGSYMSYPGEYLKSGLMTAVVIINGSSVDDSSNCTSLRQNIFGMTSFDNIFAPISAESGNDYSLIPCFTYAIVNLTAGITTSATSTYISGRIVEADVPSADMAIRAGPWVQEAIYLMPDVMSMLTMMNTTSLNTWEDLEDYVDRVVRYSYQGTWDMLYRSFDTNSSNLSVKAYESTLIASVSRIRVFAWLLISSLLFLSSALLVFGRKKYISRPIVLDGAVAALLTDPSGVLNGNEDKKDLTALSYVTKRDNEVGPLILRQIEGGFVLGVGSLEASTNVGNESCE
jgi:hypothetical protein